MQLSFADYIASLRHVITAQAPQLLADFDTYAAEALFGRAWLDDELKQLPAASGILEVGAGMFLLACQLQREGFAVTALEPVGSGFGHFHRLQKIVLEYAEQYHAVPEILPCPAEEITQQNHFDFAYSLNVMEHVNDVQTVLERVLNALKSGGKYRFVCPNYAFPFETHFKIPIIINKNITLDIFRHKILHAAGLEDSQGLWTSLNWITVSKTRCICRKLGLNAMFNHTILNVYLDRALKEPSFCARHPLIHRLIHAGRLMGLLHWLRLIPIRLLPVMDCTVTRKNV